MTSKEAGKADGDSLSVNYQPTTDRRCAKAFLEPEAAFTTALKGVKTVKKDGKGLLLINAEGKTLLRIVPSVAGACD